MSTTITSGAERFVRATAKSVSLAYEPFPKQRAFHSSNAKYRLFGGAAGPGKSKALLMEAILQAQEHPGAHTLLLRRTFPELEQSLLLYFRRDVPRELYKNFNESKHVVTWKNGSTTRFGYCQSESDVYQYQGAEFLFIGIDELTLFTLRQWQFLTSRNRCPLPGSFPCMAGATNPGNIGHAWVKSLSIDKQPAPGMENASEYDPADYDFIPARVSDNPVYAADENYLKTLRALPTHLRRAFLDGNWDVFAGQYFDNFDYARHVIRAESIRGAQVPGEGDQWPSWWPRWISIDWGFEHPAAVYWHCAMPPGTGLVADSPAAPTAAALSSRARPAASSSQAADEGSAVGFHSGGAKKDPSLPLVARDDDPGRIVTYREYVTRRTTPRDLAHEIVRRSVGSAGVSPANLNLRVPHPRASCEGGSSHDNPWRDAAHSPAAPTAALSSRAESRASSFPPSSRARDAAEGSAVGAGSQNQPRGAEQGIAAPEKIDAIYLSPDAFAHRTGEASIAEQMGDVFAEAGMPRPLPADDDRVGGWMLMYQMLASDEWLLTDNCYELIRTLPSLVRDPIRVEDIEKCDGDDPADAARYGLKSRYAAHRGDPDGWRSRMPLADRIAAHAYSADPTIRAMQSRKFALEESGAIRSDEFRRGPRPVPFAHRHGLPRRH